MNETPSPPPSAPLAWTGLVAGPLLAAALVALLPESYLTPTGETVALSAAARATAALASCMAAWWLTEAVPVAVTALLPLAVLPLVGARSLEAVARPYADPLIYLYMGGFMIAIAMERWNLHRRIALSILLRVGTTPSRIVGGFMIATALMSMWVSNTATTLMMLPIALSVIELVSRESGENTASDRFAPCLLLGVAYSASIGGIGTAIGTPPNVLLISFLKNQLGREVGFGQWLLVGLPLVLVFLPLAWLILCRVVFPLHGQPISGGRGLISERLDRLGRTQRGEWLTLAVFVPTALAWITRAWLVRIEVAGMRPLANLSDPGIALLAALALFLIPVDWRQRQFVLDWPSARKLPWDTLLLFGGGLSLARCVSETGVGEFIGASMTSLRGAPQLLVLAAVIATVVFLTELTSNLATTATLLPILASMAPGLGLDPVLLVVPAAISASCAFMLPVATPPNAIVFGTGQVSTQQMARAGLALNVIGIGLVLLLTYAVVIPLLGV